MEIITRPGNTFTEPDMNRVITKSYSKTSESFEHTQGEPIQWTEMIDDPLFLLGADECIHFMNDMAHELLGKGDHLGRKFQDILSTRRPKAFRAAVHSGTPWSGELDVTCSNGGARLFQARVKPYRHERVPRTAVILRDISETKSLRDQVLHTQRLESIGRLSSGIAHDLNNILTPIYMSVGMMRQKLNDAEMAPYIAIFEKNLRRATKLTKQIVGFSRNGSTSKQPTQVLPILTELIQLAVETFPSEIKFSTQFDSDLAEVFADETQMHQVLMNLCINARDAMPEGGDIIVKAENVVAETPGELPLIRNARYVLLTVMDTGAGIPEEILKDIFKPFFTAKKSKGTGLGLSIVHSIILDHCGIIDVRSKVGEGTVFSIYLPVYEANGEFIHQAVPAQLVTNEAMSFAN